MFVDSHLFFLCSLSKIIKSLFLTPYTFWLHLKIRLVIVFYDLSGKDFRLNSYNYTTVIIYRYIFPLVKSYVFC